MTEYKPLKGAGKDSASLLEKAAKRYDFADIGNIVPSVDNRAAPEKRKTALPKNIAAPAKPQGEVEASQPAFDKSEPIIAKGMERARAEISAPQPQPQPQRSANIAPPPQTRSAATPPMAKNIATAQTSHPVQEIDRDALKASNFIVPDGPVTGLSEEFRIVKRQLLSYASTSRSSGFDKMANRILICSAQSGEGKTFCAINLALSIAAEQDYNVLLIDADFAKPGASTIFGLNNQPGLMDALSDDRLALGDLIVPTDIDGFSILPAGNRTNRDTEFLASARTGDVLDRLAEEDPNRIMIFDSPPALAASPASELASHVGQAVMIVRADKTSESSLRDALSLVSRCEKIQLMLNGVKFSATGRSFGSYYGYGEE